jgi:hypothetical protein
MWVTMKNLTVDRMTAQVVEALRQAGVRSILLKGPAISRWLFDDDEVRPYCDCDLLVDPRRWSTAETVLARCGFRPGPREAVQADWPVHAAVWIGPGGGMVDLHHTLSAAGAAREAVWAVLSAQTDTMRVAGVDVEVLRPPARALALVLHAAKDGIRIPKVQTDLQHALQRLEPSVWEEAAVLAKRLEAMGAFATGLRLLPEGEALAARLQLSEKRPALVALRAGGGPPMSAALLWLGEEQRWRRRIKLVVRKVFPPPEYLRDWHPLAQRGRLGLTLAYVWRPLWMLWHLSPALRAVRRARADGRNTPS